MFKDFFGQDMLFYTFDDFMKRRLVLKTKLAFRDASYLFHYRMYVESRPWVKSDYYRGCIWDYLNGYMTEEKICEEYEKYKRKYGDVNE